jgi:hypothetical protein
MREYEGGTWSFQSKLMTSDYATSDRFGYALSLYDGNLAVSCFADDDKGEYSGISYIYANL